MNRILTSVFISTALSLASCGGQFTEIGEGAAGSAGSAGKGSNAGAGGSTGGSAGSVGSGGSSGGAGGGTGGGMTGGSGGSGGGTVYEPCAGKVCGTLCTLCAPNQPDCVEDSSVKYCGDDGSCRADAPTCAVVECTTGADCPQPGAPCQTCPDGSLACPTVECVGGSCVGSFPTCASVECTMDADCPQSLAPCQVCADGTTACPWARCEGGVCTSGVDSCAGDSPCEGKACGDPCTLCSGPDCPAVPAVVMFCDESLTCQLNQPACVNQCSEDADCPMTELCAVCADSSCAVTRCTGGACVYECPTPPADPCGGCAAGELCVYQLGGPGPSHYVCASAPPCRAAGVCDCVRDQGTCTPQPATDTEPAICACENGLE